jgi:hypothetical protein
VSVYEEENLLGRGRVRQRAAVGLCVYVHVYAREREILLSVCV